MRAKNSKKATSNKTQAAEAKNDSKKVPWWFNQPLPIDRFTGWLVAWTSCLSLATVGLILVSILQWRELRNTDDHIADQVRIAAEQLKTMEAGQRAWVEIKSVEMSGPLTIKGNSVQAGFKIVMKNTGNLPALGVINIIHIYPKATIDHFPPKCSINTSVNSSWGFSLFPNEVNDSFFSPIGSTEDGDEITPSPKEGEFVLNVVGCILYESAGDPKTRLTGFSGAIIPIGSGNPDHDFFRADKTQYEANELQFVLFSHVGQDAR